MDVFNIINEHLMSPPALKADRLPTFYPSAASCVSGTDGAPIGACLRSQYYRCAGYSKTNPTGLFPQYIFAAGNWWEDWVIEQLKQTGHWVGNSIKFQDLERYISGEVDIVIKDPDTGENIIVEMKTYGSSNYQAKKEICGGRDNKPKPKDQNVLQSFLYLGYFADQGINKVLLAYLDRACGSPENNKQFMIEKHVEGDKTYCKISTTERDGTPYSYIDRRITLEGIYARYASLMEHLKESRMPAPDYTHVFSAAEVRQRHSDGLIAKTRMANWERNAEKYPIGDWQCSYCDYKDQCKADQDFDKESEGE